MSDKDLSESEWRNFVKSPKNKDKKYEEKDFKDFFKALGALETATRGKDFEAQQKAADEIEKQAGKLRSNFKTDKEILSMLGDADKELTSRRKLVDMELKKAEAAKKKEEESGGDDEEESPALLTTKLIPLLREVKNKKGDVTMPVLIALAGKECVVLVSRKAISPARGKLLKEQMTNPSGLKFVRGDVLWEENALTFVVQSQAAGLAKKLKAALHAQTEVRHKVRVRGEDGETDDDGDPIEELEQAEKEAEDGGTTGSIPPAPPLNKPEAKPEAGTTTTTPTPDPEAAKFSARFAALLPKVKEAIAAGNTEVKVKASTAGEHARKKEFVQAHALLDEAEKLMKPAGGGGGEIPEAPPLPTGEKPAPKVQESSADADAFKARLTAMIPKLKELATAKHPDAADINLKISEAGVFARKKEFEQANALLDEAEEMIANASKPAATTTAPQIPDASEEQWLTRFAEVEPRYLDMLKNLPDNANELRTVMNYANGQAEAEQYGKAVAALARLEKLLDASGPAEDMGHPGIVAYRTSLLEFRKAAAQVTAQIASLKAAIPSQLPEQADLADQLADTLDELTEDLLDTVDEAINAAKDEAEPVSAALAASIDKYLAELKSNTLVRHADSNPFGVKVSIASVLGDALSEIKAKMPETA